MAIHCRQRRAPVNRRIWWADIVGLLSIAIMLGCSNASADRAANIHAYQALRRLEERQDASPAIYEPRYLDAEKAVDEATGIVSVSMKLCLVYFESYRNTKDLETRKQAYECVSGIRKKLD